jgi:hypothetical protein
MDDLLCLVDVLRKDAGKQPGSRVDGRGTYESDYYSINEGNTI